MRLRTPVCAGLFAAFLFVQAVCAQTNPKLSLKWPVCSGLAGFYGWRIDEFTGQRVFHSGIDLAGAYGDIVRAAASGRVVSAELRGPYGLTVETDSGNGVRLRYGHFSTLLVSDGDFVKAGEPIGQIGATGRVRFPQVHFEVWIGGETFNPLLFLSHSSGCVAVWPDLSSADRQRSP